MTENRKRLPWGRQASLAGRVGVLSLATLAVCGVVAPVAGWLVWPTGMLAAVAAALFCWLGALLALFAELPFHNRWPDQAWMGFTAGMLPRMGVPLASAVILHFCGGPLASAGALYYLVVFYVILLGIEAAMSLPGEPQGLRCGDDRRKGTF